MKQIPLRSKKYPGLFALVDDADYDRCMQLTWCVMRRNINSCLYASGYIWNDETQKSHKVYLHRFVLGLKRDEPMVDHKNGSGLDCQRANMRLASSAQNQHNHATRKDNSSGYRGVSWHKGNKRWTAQISYEGHNRTLGG